MKKQTWQRGAFDSHTVVESQKAIWRWLLYNIGNYSISLTCKWKPIQNVLYFNEFPKRLHTKFDSIELPPTCWSVFVVKLYVPIFLRKSLNKKTRKQMHQTAILKQSRTPFQFWDFSPAYRHAGLRSFLRWGAFVRENVFIQAGK